jgi:hypothetical protein
MQTHAAYRLMVTLDRADDTLASDAMVAQHVTDGADVTVVAPLTCGDELRAAARALGVREVILLDAADSDRSLCDLVAHIRRLKPEIVLDLGDNQLTRTTVARAADPRFGHVCSSRGAHVVRTVKQKTRTE